MFDFIITLYKAFQMKYINIPDTNFLFKTITYLYLMYTKITHISHKIKI